MQVIDEDKGQAYCRLEGVNTAAVSRGNSSPILKATKYALNFVALLRENFILLGGAFRFLLGEMQGVCLCSAIPPETSLHRSLDLKAVPEFVAWKSIVFYPLTTA